MDPLGEARANTELVSGSSPAAQAVTGGLVCPHMTRQRLQPVSISSATKLKMEGCKPVPAEAIFGS